MSTMPPRFRDTGEDQKSQQLDLFQPCTGQSTLLDTALWSRRQNRRDLVKIEGLESGDAMLLPLVLALARLSAQRDARAIETARSMPARV